ncbi:MAG TPA: DUF3570 domain-containing protein [Opitutaceae bacterium]|nr:DUF3570 domain-containing protein [Opitutaceae bacterium]
MKLSADLFTPASQFRGAAIAAFLFLLVPRARAEGGISYKYQDYQEAGGRIGVQVHSALIEQGIGTEMRLKLAGVVDAISGATPNGQPAPAGSDQVPFSKIDERRKAWNAEFSRQFPRINVALGVANSRESDYVSTGWSVNTLTDFNEKNTTLLAGVAATDDDVRVFYQADYAKKRATDLIVGVTQLLDPRTSVTFNLSWGRSTGYLSDPYKAVEKRAEVIPGVFLQRTFPENRPAERTKWLALASLNRAFPELHGALEGSYRFYHDTFGTDAHTLDLAWFHRIGSKVILRPGFRFYQQSAADFFHYRLDATTIVPTFGAPRPQGPFYSSDYRLSAMRTTTAGLKATWQVTSRLELDAAYERYQMRGRDGIVPQSAYARADIVTVGARFTW